MKKSSIACFAIIASSLCACSGPPIEVTRTVTGTLVAPPGTSYDTVYGVSTWSTETQVYTHPDETGFFSFLVYGSGALRLSVMDAAGKSNVIHFARNDGAMTSILNVSVEPVVHLTPKNGAGAGDIEYKVIYEPVAIKLGKVTDADGDGLFETQYNPLAQVDYDDDGLADALDIDMDGDGIVDTADKDLDNDGADDVEENNDKNNDGFPDEQNF